MPSGLIALLDDVATIAKLAASSFDDVAGAAGKASTKAAGVVIDDTAVTPRYVVGLSPERELPIIGKIAPGALKNKLLILLPAALLLTAFAPFLIIPLLMLGGSYLAFEATEKIAELVLHDHGHEEQLVDAMADPADLERFRSRARSAPISSCRPRSWRLRWPASTISLARPPSPWLPSPWRSPPASTASSP